jgi:pimeloyl-ACP methyl ester carboxylesterase
VYVDRGKVPHRRHGAATRVAAVLVCLIAAALAPGPMPGWGRAAAASQAQVKELNFVFLHGMGATSASVQSLADTIEEEARAYVSAYQQANPGTAVRINTLQRSYPKDVDVAAWAGNIADAVKKHFAGKRDLILVGHSMGGKAALYAAARNIGNIGDLTALVVTINSPVKSLNDYYVVGGGSVTDYIRVSRVITDNGVAGSLGSYDSSADGKLVGTGKHWLALVSAESAPLSPQFEFSGVDPYPRDMDDVLVPISAQYADGADAVYYGEWGHSAFSDNPSLTTNIAGRILSYVFGGEIPTGVLGPSASVEHRAGWLPFPYHWEDRGGESAGPSGIISHSNRSFFKWQQWEDIVGSCTPGNRPAAYWFHRDSLPVLSSASQVRWLNPDDPADCRLLIITRAAPRSQVRVRWNIRQHQPLPPGVDRDHYEIKVSNGTSVAGISGAAWLTGDPDDTRLQVSSSAQGPFRWFRADVSLYRRHMVSRNLIDQILPETLPPSN